MAAVPNLSGKVRAGQVLAGVVLVAWGLFGAQTKWAIILWLALGGALIVEGLIGFSLVRRMLRLGSKTR